MRILTFFLHLFFVALLTVLTQVGGLVYLLSFLTHRLTDARAVGNVQKRSFRIATFVMLYLLVTFLVVPPLARQFGRVPMPVSEKNHVLPVNVFTCILNRHYVRTSLRKVVFDVADQLASKHPGVKIMYMDGNFPFGPNFPLPPHLSHKDGKKLDIALCYTDNSTGKCTVDYPPYIGYGISEEVLPGETNLPEQCTKKGKWMYSWMHRWMPKGDKEAFTFDINVTGDMVRLFAGNPQIQRIFLEPHLEERLGLKFPIVKPAGCHSVRHDDHIHIQIH